MVAEGGEHSAADTADPLDALAYRFVGLLLLLGGALLLLVPAGLWCLPRTDDGDGMVFVLPSVMGQHGIGAGVVPVLAASGALIAGTGGLALVWAARAPRPRGRQRATGPRPRGRPRWRALAVLAGGLVFLAVVILRR